MNSKNIVYVVVLLVIIGVVWYIVTLNKQTPNVQTQNNQDVTQTSDTPQTPKAPQFLFGSVVRTEGQNIIIKVDSAEKTIITDEKTEIVKKVKINGADGLEPAVFSDIKPSTNIIVSYTETSGSGYKANIIQILP